MNPREWFGEHANSVRIIALGGGLVLAVIILLDIMAGKKKSNIIAPSATDAATGAVAPSGSQGASLSPGYENISIFEDYSSHTGNDVTSNTYTSPGVAAAGVARDLQGGSAGPDGIPSPAPRFEGGPVPIPTPHSADMYTVQSGDSLWAIAQRKLGNGFDWRELYNWNRSTVGDNPNLIYPGEVLKLGA